MLNTLRIGPRRYKHKTKILAMLNPRWAKTQYILQKIYLLRHCHPGLNWSLVAYYLCIKLGPKLLIKASSQVLTHIVLSIHGRKQTRTEKCNPFREHGNNLLKPTRRHTLLDSEQFIHELWLTTCKLRNVIHQLGTATFCSSESSCYNRWVKIEHKNKNRNMSWDSFVVIYEQQK